MVEVARNGSLVIITICRPERKNAVDGQTAHALYKAFKAFDKDPTADVAILTGANGTFCAGADLHAFDNPLEEGGELGPMGPTRLLLGKPVIAAIEGFAVAGGLELALWCDLRVAASDSLLGVFCRRHGVPLIDGGTLRLRRLVGLGRALDLTLTGREVSAQEALSMGLVSRVCPPGEALHSALNLARQIAAFPQGTMRSDRMGTLTARTLAEEFRLGAESLAAGAAGAQSFAAWNTERKLKSKL